MTKPITTVMTAMSLIAGFGIAGPVLSEATKQTIVLTEVDPIVLATGWHETEVIGARVFNDAGEDIGKIQDISSHPTTPCPMTLCLLAGFLAWTPITLSSPQPQCNWWAKS